MSKKGSAMTVQGSFSGQGHAPCTQTGRHHVLAAAACGVTDFIRSQGGRPAHVLHRAGVPERNLDQPTLALDLAAYVRMMEVAAEETGNENFGLLYGRHFQPGILGLIGAIALAAPPPRPACRISGSGHDEPGCRRVGPVKKLPPRRSV